MTTPPASQNIIHRGFTLVELLIGMTVIAILAGLITVAAARAFTRAREFAIQTEMTQIESAIKQFEIQYDFYPPSFSKGIGAANDLLPFLARIAPNHNETAIVTGTTRRIDVWWTNVGANIAATPGADLVFWLSAISKNKQFPLTATDINDLDGDGDMTEIIGLPAHGSVAGDSNEREVFFVFKSDQLNITGDVATYRQNNRSNSIYQYLDAANYLPSSATASDGAYCRPGVTQMQVTDAATDAGIFESIYYNPKTFQLITFGLDDAPGVAMSPNSISSVEERGADNIVNFGNDGPARLDVVLFQ